MRGAERRVESGAVPRHGKRVRLRTAAALGHVFPPAVALAVAITVWELWTRIADVPVYILPAPHVVLERLVSDLGFFARHGAVTLVEAMAGFTLGLVVALSGAVLMAHSRLLERTLYPLALLVKVTPIVAVAPMLVIWFGFSPVPNVLIAALIAFFPVLVNSLTGLRSVNPGTLDFLRSVDASQTQVLLKLRAPSALPFLFAAFRIAIPLSVIGAVVAEFFSGDRGLGNVIFVAHHNLDMPTSFSAILVLAVMGITLTVVTSIVERRVLFWHDSFVSP